MVSVDAFSAFEAVSSASSGVVATCYVTAFAVLSAVSANARVVERDGMKPNTIASVKNKRSATLCNVMFVRAFELAFLNVAEFGF